MEVSNTKTLIADWKIEKMNWSDIHTYIPFVLGYIVIHLIQLGIFVKPEQLEKVHREILEEVEKKYATKVDSENLKEHIDDMKCKIDKIYDKLIGGVHDTTISHN